MRENFKKQRHSKKHFIFKEHLFHFQGTFHFKKHFYFNFTKNNLIRVAIKTINKVVVQNLILQ